MKGLIYPHLLDSNIIIEYKGYIGLTSSDWDLTVGLVDKDYYWVLETIIDNNGCSNIRCNPELIVMSNHQTITKNQFFEGDVAGWVMENVLVNYKRGVCIMKVPKINLTLYSLYCSKVLGSPKVYVSLEFDTDDYDRIAYVEYVNVKYSGITSLDFLRNDNIEVKPS